MYRECYSALRIRKNLARLVWGLLCSPIKLPTSVQTCSQCHSKSVPVVFDPGGMDPLADLILRNESASVFNLPQNKFVSRSVPSQQK